MSQVLAIPGFEILREIAAGSSGRVFLARQIGLDRDVALKVLSPGLFDADETRARFLRETRLQASLTHPGVLALYDAGFSGRVPYIAFELVEGGSLREQIGANPAGLPVGEALRLAGEIAGGLAAAHEIGIVHRDLKPENVLLTPDGAARVADFGIAKGHRGRQTLHTAEGVILGTPGYMAPEVLRGEVATAASDIYALGVILFELLTGRQPFQSADLSKALELQLRGDPPAPSSFRHELAPELDALTLRCLDRTPTMRPDSAAELAVDFSRLQEKLRRVRAMPAADGPGRRRRRQEPPAARTLSSDHLAQGPASSEAPRSGAASSGVTPAADSTRVPVTARSAPVPLRSRQMSAAVGLGFAFSVISALAIGFAMGQRSVARPSEPRDPSVAREVKAPSAVRRLTTGAHDVALELEGPLPPETRLYLRDRAGSLFLMAPDAADARCLRAGGLEPGQSYEVVTAPPESLPVAKCATIPALAPGAAFLHENRHGARDASLAAAGDSLLLGWRCKHFGATYGAVIVESRDGGRTWSAPRALSEGTDPVESFRLLEVEGGVLAWWRAAGGIELRFREAGRPGRSGVESVTPEGSSGDSTRNRGDVESRFISCGKLEVPPGISAAARGVGGVAGILVASLISDVNALVSGRYPLLFAGLEHLPGSASEPRAAVAVTEMLENLKILTTGRGALTVLEYDSGVPGLPDVLYRSTSPSRDGAGWSDVVQVTESSEDVYTWDVAARGDRVVLAYTLSEALRVMVSRDGGERFDPPFTPVISPHDAGFPVLIAGDGGFELAFIQLTVTTGGAQRDVTVLESPDGLSWRPRSTRVLPLLAEETNLAMTATPEGLAVAALDEDGRLAVTVIPRKP